MSKCRPSSGFALLLVLIVLAMAVIMGYSYLSTASVYHASASHYTDMARARYLAESGAQHAMYLLRERPDMLQGSDAKPIGPFTVDDAGDGYTVSVASTSDPSQFVITCKAISRHSTQSCQVTAQRGALLSPSLKQALLVNGNVTLPVNLMINGPLHVNGSLINNGIVMGQATATGAIQNNSIMVPLGQTVAAPVAMPAVKNTDYYHYVYNEKAGAASITYEDNLDKNDKAFKGNANVTTDNPAGVLVVRPPVGKTLSRISAGVNFIGTLVVEGDLVIEGDKISLTPMDGFPALIVTGHLYIKGDTKAVFNGVVLSVNGLEDQDCSRTSVITINGGLTCQTGQVLSPNMQGTFTINYSATKTDLVDPSGLGRYGPVTVVGWDG